MTFSRTIKMLPCGRYLLSDGALSRIGRREPDLSVLAPLLEFLPPAPPPVGLLARIERRVDMLRRAQSIADMKAKRKRKVQRTLMAGLAGILAGVAAMTAIVMFDPIGVRNNREPTLLAILAGSEGARVLRVESVEGGRFLRLQHAGPQASASRDLELWLIPGGDGAPVSLGLLAGKGNVTVLPREYRIRAGDVLALSEEPAGGSPTGRPTGPVLVRAFVYPFGKPSPFG